MSVTIDELHVETHSPQAQAGSAKRTEEKPQAKPDFEGEFQRMRERELRLRAD